MFSEKFKIAQYTFWGSLSGKGTFFVRKFCLSGLDLPVFWAWWQGVPWKTAIFDHRLLCGAHHFPLWRIAELGEPLSLQFSLPNHAHVPITVFCFLNMWSNFIHYIVQKTSWFSNSHDPHDLVCWISPLCLHHSLPGTSPQISVASRDLVFWMPGYVYVWLLFPVECSGPSLGKI